MSKSKGNVVNPLDIIDEYGADALRMGIMMNRGSWSAAGVFASNGFKGEISRINFECRAFH